MLLFTLIIFMLTSELSSFILKSPRKIITILKVLPNEVVFQPNQLEILSILGKIDVMVDRATVEEVKNELERQGETDALKSLASSNPISPMNRITSVRLFEAKLIDGSRCFVKEFLPIGLIYGKRELSVTRKLGNRWRTAQTEQPDYADESPPFPVLLGYLKTDSRILDKEFRTRWVSRFPRSRPPDANNIWLVYSWDEYSFNSIRSYPALPQIVEGLDYFLKNKRTEKRWKFVKFIIKKSLEAIEHFHRNGYTHNSISSDSLWMSTRDERYPNQLRIRLTDLGLCQKTAELGNYARVYIFEDLYQLGLVFMQLILSSFSETFTGSTTTRQLLDEISKKENPRSSNNNNDDDDTNNASKKSAAAATTSTTITTSHLSQRELQTFFEKICQEDIILFREKIRETAGWEEAVACLEKNDGAAWKLIFKMLARGKLYDNEKERQLKVTAGGLIRDSKELFENI